MSGVKNQDAPYTLWFSSRSLDCLKSREGWPTRESEWLKDWCHCVISAHCGRRRMFIFHSLAVSVGNRVLLSLFRYVWIPVNQMQQCTTSWLIAVSNSFCFRSFLPLIVYVKLRKTACSNRMQSHLMHLRALWKWENSPFVRVLLEYTCTTRC